MQKAKRKMKNKNLRLGYFCALRFSFCIPLGYFINASFHIKCGFGFVIVLACENLGKASDCIFNFYKFARDACKYFRDKERLGQEALDFAGAIYGKLVLVRKLLHAENVDDILQFRIA